MFSPFRTHPAFLALFLMPLSLLAQQPSGNDISSAIPIFLGQTIEDIGDEAQNRNRVYRITLARGQELSVVATSTAQNRRWYAAILAPTTASLGTITGAQNLRAFGTTALESINLRYEAPAAGNYFIWLNFTASGMRFTLRASATGTPIAVPNPTSAGCLSGTVDSITYSLQFIALGLPDEVTIGGTRACPSCTVKPPLYPEISSRLEETMRANGRVEACYDSTGNIFQLKLLRP